MLAAIKITIIQLLPITINVNTIPIIFIIVLLFVINPAIIPLNIEKTIEIITPIDKLVKILV